MASILRRLSRDEAGGTGIEYAIIVAVVSVVAWGCGSHLVEAATDRTAGLANAMSSPGSPDGASAQSWTLSSQCRSASGFELDDRRGRGRCSR